MPAQTEFNTPSITIKSKGYLIWKDLLLAVKSWFDSEYYDFAETTHKYRPDERELEIVGERKLNEYVKYKITVTIAAMSLKDVEIIKEGNKINMQEGRVMVQISGLMLLDWQKRFGGNKFLQGVQDFYHKYIIKQKIEIERMDPFMFKLHQLSKLINQKLYTTKETD